MNDKHITLIDIMLDIAPGEQENGQMKEKMKLMHSFFDINYQMIA